MKYLFVLFFASNLAMASRLDLPENSVEAKGVFKISADWVKDKGSKYDIRLNFQNLSDTGVIVFSANVECFRNGTRGQIKYTFFNTGERTIDFKPNETKSSNFVCSMENKQSPEEYKIVIKGIYENKALDGKTVSQKPLVKELVWSLKLINGLPTVKEQ